MRNTKVIPDIGRDVVNKIVSDEKLLNFLKDFLTIGKVIRIPKSGLYAEYTEFLLSCDILEYDDYENTRARISGFGEFWANVCIKVFELRELYQDGNSPNKPAFNVVCSVDPRKLDDAMDSERGSQTVLDVLSDPRNKKDLKNLLSDKENKD